MRIRLEDDDDPKEFTPVVPQPKKSVWIVEVLKVGIATLSDRRFGIIGVYSSKESAERAAEVFNKNNALALTTQAKVSVHIVDPETQYTQSKQNTQSTQDKHRGPGIFYVRMRKNGSLISVTDATPQQYREHYFRIAYEVITAEHILEACVSATNEEHAIEIINRMRLQYLEGDLRPSYISDGPFYEPFR